MFVTSHSFHFKVPNCTIFHLATIDIDILRHKKPLATHKTNFIFKIYDETINSVVMLPLLFADQLDS